MDCRSDGRSHSMLRPGRRNDQLRPLGQGVFAIPRQVPFDELLRSGLRGHGLQLRRSNRHLVRNDAWRHERTRPSGPVLATQRGVAGNGFCSVLCGAMFASFGAQTFTVAGCRLEQRSAPFARSCRVNTPQRPHHRCHTLRSAGARVTALGFEAMSCSSGAESWRLNLLVQTAVFT